MSRLRIKAGKKAYEIIKDGGFNFDAVSAYYGAAVGPRWLIASGFDLTLLTQNLLGRSRSVHLIGSSAGAWRFAAWLQPQAADCYRKFIHAYITVGYTRKDTPVTILEKFSHILNTYIEDDALPFALANKRYRLSVITARARGLVASEKYLLQKSALAACYVLNFFSRNNLYHFADRVVFYGGSKPPPFCFQPQFQGKYVRINESNFKYAVMASGAIPLIVAGVKNIFGAPHGVYRDGGLIDYHLSHQFAAKENELVLFFHHQERIIPGWLDKKNKRRIPDDQTLNNVVMVFPSQSFIDRLPSGKAPDRDDFLTYIDKGAERIAHWNKAMELAAPLGEDFLELVDSGKIREMVEKF
ncbi:MAG: cytoplasmic protein [Syntrophaceae bacterium]|nr:MAG: cytoplasmic protein [Syntrophaceae bacterium]